MLPGVEQIPLDGQEPAPPVILKTSTPCPTESLPSVADADLAKARRPLYKSLEVLGLGGCKQRTDNALDSLAEMGGLTTLSLDRNPQFSASAVRKFKAALHGCNVISDYPNVK